MSEIGFTLARAKSPLDGTFGARLRKCEEEIRSGESTGIEARWEFGRALLKRREGKQLPKGLLGAVKAEFGLSPGEVQARMRFAEQFADKPKVLDAVKHFGTWKRITHEALPKKQVKRKRKSPEQLEVRRLANAIAKCHRDEVDEALYAEYDHLYDILLAFFNTHPKKAAK